MNFIYNWTDTDFVYSWDSVPYKLEAGQVYHDVLVSVDGGTRIIIVPGIAEHFAKHLADREMMNRKQDVRRLDIHADYMQKAVTLPEAVEPPEIEEPKEIKEEAKEEVLKEPVTEAPKKRGRKKNVVETVVEVAEE